ncbi:MAG: tRNA glutamyl-Q(34) synthetase GluQRS [Kangiellaceae bacterium]|jgi:glutamyl-Q tRNA(Asp) synthetase|nr:tRNA glutamyl-Q(34) synthetase GluQRS [Kangiellaceae bacterium]
MTTKHYRGRFAPSPTGPLHFGSLYSAVASYVDAKANHGQWLIRIEDLDPPREVAGAADEIIATLASFGLHSDEPILFQSTRLEAYQAIADELLEHSHAYYCHCSRKQIQATGGVYQNICREKKLAPGKQASDHQPMAIRLQQTSARTGFIDAIQQAYQLPKEQVGEDFIIKRRDDLFAYQLAVVADDIEQNITHIVRGADLIDSTLKQLTLYDALGKPYPKYAHVPMIVDQHDQKLSKQNYAPAISACDAQRYLVEVLELLGQQPDASLVDYDCETILQWAINHWSLAKISSQTKLSLA